MKKTTKLILGAFLITLSLNAGVNYVYPWQPQGEYSSCTSPASVGYYITSNAGWSSSEYYQIIDIDAAKLTNATLPQFTGLDGSKNANDIDFKSGFFGSPIMTTTDGTVYTPTNLMWPVKYHFAAFAPTMYTSAYSKKVINGLNPSGAYCYVNDNTVKTSAIYDKPGFIELSRIHKATATYPKDSLGYIEIDSLPAVDRIQWSYSSTSIKRGVKMDLNFNDGNGWIPRRWVASDYSNFEGSFAEQGYQFEEIIGQGDNTGVTNPITYVSLRIRIWDGDSIHFKVNANDLSEQAVLYTATMKPTAYQTVRVHQIKVYSGLIPTKVPEMPNAVHNVSVNDLIIYRSGNNIIIGENSNIEIYTLEGRKIYKGYTNKINVSGFSKGTYILRSINDNGIIRNKKIMI